MPEIKNIKNNGEKQGPSIVKVLDPEKMSLDQMELVAEGLIEELKRLRTIECFAQKVFNSRFPKNIISEQSSVPSKYMNQLGAALKVLSNLCTTVKGEDEKSEPEKLNKGKQDG